MQKTQKYKKKTLWFDVDHILQSELIRQVSPGIWWVRLEGF